MRHIGTVRPGSTIYIPFETFGNSSPAPITLTGLATTDIKVYKDGGTTERASASGYALLDTDGIDFDLLTGIHGVSIDLADNTTAGFWAAGSKYFVVIGDVTVDSLTMRFLAASFDIGYPQAIINTTIATLASQTSFTLTSGPAEDSALAGMEVIIHDVASAVQLGKAVISAYTGSTKTVTLAAATTYTVAATDNIAIVGPAYLAPTVIGRALDVSTGGEAGLDWANIGSPTTTVVLSGTTVKTATDVETDTADIQSRLPAALVSGRIDASVGAVAANAITAASIATDAIDADALAANAVTEIAAGISIPSAATVAAAVWDLDATAHQTQGTFGQVLGDSGADTDSVWALANTNLDATISSRLATSGYTAPPSAATNAAAVWDLDATSHQTQGTFGQVLGDSGADTDSVWSLANTNLDATVSSRLSTAGYTAPPSAATVADAVWDEDATAHQTQGTFGQAIGDPGIDTDTIFGLVNTNLDAAMSTRASQTSLDTVDDFLDTEVAAILAAVDTEVAAIKAKTDNLPADPADASDIAASFVTVNTKLDTIDDFLDLEIAAIKAKTDQLVFTSSRVDANVTGQIAVKKNTALTNFEFIMTDSTNHDPMTSLTVTVQRSIDGASFATAANSAAEVGSGVYKIDLADTDLNGNVITLKFTGSGADTRFVTILTQA